MKMKKYTREERIIVWGLIILFNVFAMFVISTKDASLFNIEASAKEAKEEVVDESIYNIPAQLPEFIPTLDLPIDADTQHLIYSICKNMDMDYALCLGIIDAESDFLTDVVSFNGSSRGLMQINYDNDKNLKSKYGFTDLDAIDQNVMAGIIIYQENLTRYGTKEKALMAYNMRHDRCWELWSQGITTSEYAEEVKAEAAKYERLIAEAKEDYYMGY